MLPNIVETVVVPGLALLPANMNTREARAMLLAIGLQESRFLHRRQIGGPARGFWQFEMGRLSGLAGLFRLRTTSPHMAAVCAARGVRPDADAVYAQLERDDLLACAVARLLLWSDPQRLPPAEADAADSAWATYIRTWRPGKPHRHTWDRFWRAAVEAA